MWPVTPELIGAILDERRRSAQRRGLERSFKRRRRLQRQRISPQRNRCSPSEIPVQWPVTGVRT